MTWGADWAGGDSGAVQARLTNVQRIQATRFAFAAILADRSVVTWGDYRWGGDSIKVQDQLRNVQQIQASMFAFVAILGGGSVATWGHDPSACYGRWGYDSSGRYSGQIQHQLKNVQQIRGLLETEPNWGSWADILGDGSVATWGCGCIAPGRAARNQLARKTMSLYDPF